MALHLVASSPVAEAPAPLTLGKGRISIGRSTDCDWTLTDPTHQLSSRHCEIAWVGDGYAVADTSTNGTLLNNVALSSAQRIVVGDVLAIGPFEIRIVEGDVAQAPVAQAGTGTLTGQLATALAGLARTRARQRGELGVTQADPLARNPLAADDPGAALAALAPAAAARAIADAAAAIDRHNAAALMAMQQVLREMMAELDPEAIAAAAKPRPGLSDEARDAALWRAYAARAGKGGKEDGFLDRFAAAFRQAYQRLAALN